MYNVQTALDEIDILVLILFVLFLKNTLLIIFVCHSIPSYVISDSLIGTLKLLCCISFFLPHVALFTCLSVCVINYKTVNKEDFLIDRKFTYFEFNEIEIVDVVLFNHLKKNNLSNSQMNTFCRYITFHSLF
jgi:uncharacterized membrane protein required for colicin V production